LPDSIQSFEDGFSAKRRQQLRRNRRKLTNTGGVAIKRCITPEDLPLFTDALFNLHNQRRLLLGDPGCFIRKPAEADFYRNFLPKALDKGWLRFNALTQDGDIQAIQIGYAYNHTFFQLQEGFNPEYIKGAGNVLRHITIDECIQEGISAYDFLGGFSEHKRRWGAELRQGHDLLVGHPSLKNRLFFLKDIWPTGRYISEEGLFDGN
ncbi:MAG: GNAT family N-acetyltransferase, partial [Candidatus Thiodiazotropha sp. (ex Monitilora ramsayi)]|nr:GNAT family N-acetyltransferase [Candidatus Thiodiazotropha sp. (ex Monitilora ramsayi)]